MKLGEMLDKVKSVVFLLSSRNTDQLAESSKKIHMDEIEADLNLIGLITRAPEQYGESWISQKRREETEWAEFKWTKHTQNEKEEWEKNN